MVSPLQRGFVGLVFGVMVGSAMGVAAFGGAVNGGFVFGPIGFILGWLSGQEKAIAPAEVGIDPSIEQIAVSEVETSLPDLKIVEGSVNEIIPIVGRLLASIWNLQMRGFIAIGVMEQIVLRPWILFAAALLFLVIFYPFGILFSVTGMVAMHYGASPDTRFLVDIARR